MSLSDDNKIYVDAISFLSKCLERYHHQKVVILIDEYDVPLENAYFAGFYDEMTVFIRSLMESALKTNESLKLAVITGCLRISKESIFTGLNNLNVISVISDSFAGILALRKVKSQTCWNIMSWKTRQKILKSGMMDICLVRLMYTIPGV